MPMTATMPVALAPAGGAGGWPLPSSASAMTANGERANGVQVHPSTRARLLRKVGRAVLYRSSCRSRVVRVQRRATRAPSPQLAVAFCEGMSAPAQPRSGIKRSSAAARRCSGASTLSAAAAAAAETLEPALACTVTALDAQTHCKAA
jgi:hypothetical protein